MVTNHGVIFEWAHPPAATFSHGRRNLLHFSRLAVALIAFALGGIAGPLTPTVRLETAYLLKQANLAIAPPSHPLPPSVPVVFNPLVTPDGASIAPVNTDFSLIIPKIGVNAAVIPAVNPADTKEYMDVLKKGIAHASTSYFPGEGTTYLFSHSTNYDWFVSDLNAVFYHLKNLTEGDTIVLFYKGKQFTYRLTEKKIVAPSEISYLVGVAGDKRLILQTCWPPGSTTERLLIFANLVEERGSIL
jgi:LPXTG-site transpeptidase (sortase) family protein